jgi:hypothetical protein
MDVDPVEAAEAQAAEAAPAAASMCVDCPRTEGLLSDRCKMYTVVCCDAISFEVKKEALMFSTTLKHLIECTRNAYVPYRYPPTVLTPLIFLYCP